MKSLITKLAIVSLLAIGSTPMHGNWLTNIGHGISNSVSNVFSPISKAIWSTKLFWHTKVRQDRWYAFDTTLRAAKTGNVSKTKWFMQRATGLCTTPLHSAVVSADPQVVKGLIGAGADVNAKDAHDWTLLHEAASKGNPEVAKLLVSARADVNAKNFEGITPLHEAASEGNPEVAKVLISARADVNAKDSFGETPLYRIDRYPRSKTKVAAARSVAKILIDAGAAVNTKDSFEATPLHFANIPEVTKILIGAGAIVNAKDSYGKTPLHGAAFYCNHATYDLLVKAGALQIKDNEGKTPEDLLKKCTSKK